MNKHIQMLRPYQNRAIKQVYESMRTYRTTALQLPTGSGKSVIAGAILEHALQHNKRVNFLVDRIVLSDQMYQRLRDAGLPVSVMQASHPLYNPSLPIQVVSIQTLARRDRRYWPPADLFFHDEMHVQYDAVYRVMDKWNAIPWIGLSATPFTTGLGLKWQNLVVGATTRELIEQGYLCDYEAYGPSAPDLVGVRHQGGDYAPNDLAERRSASHPTSHILRYWLVSSARREYWPTTSATETAIPLGGRRCRHTVLATYR
jgi:superfamily II DNA or RNA helicase